MDDPGGARDGQLFRAEAVGKGPLGVALKLADLLKEAGLPDGVFSVVAGRADRQWRAIIAHPGIAAISFVGSTAIAETIYRGGTSAR